MDKHFKIGVAFPKWFDSFNRVIRGAFEYVSQNRRFQLIDMSYFQPEEVPECILQNDHQSIVDGLLLWMPSPSFREVRLKLPEDLPIVGLGHELDEYGIPCVKENLKAQMTMLVEHLHDVGIRHLAYMHCSECSGSKGFEDAYRRQVNRHHAQAHVFHYPYPTPPNVADQHNNHELEAWLEQLEKPVGVICFGPIGADLLSRACRRKKLDIPHDVAIACRIDDRPCLLNDPPITALQFPDETMGGLMMTMLNCLLNGMPVAQRDDIAPAGLIVRGSTGQVDEDYLIVMRAQRHIEDHACAGLTVEQLIEQTQTISRSKFFTLFKDYTSRSPYEAIREVRIRQACQYLATTNLPISKVATLCGYAEPRHFSTAFGREMGQTPSAYRKLHHHHQLVE